MNVVLFEDSAVDLLSPITLLRPAYTVTCGGLRLLDIASSFGPPRGIVRSHLAEFQQDYFSDQFDAFQPTLYLNARLVPDAGLIPRLQELIGTSVHDKASWCVLHDGHPSVAFAPAGVVPDLAQTSGQTIADFLSCQLPSTSCETKLFEYPHDVIAAHSEVIQDNLEFIISSGSYQEISEGVYAPPGTTLPPNVAFETDAGPVVMDEGVSLGAFAVIRGPVRLGAHVSVSPHTLLKGPVSIGTMCKAGGEISHAIIEPYSNKVHFGYLGSSYVGSWVNLGAGTTNSNLKNTYGQIRVTYDDQKVDTGMQFLGCVIGDFTKTAINTSIFTGKVLGVCSNVYGTVTTNVPSFSNYARSFGEVTEHPAEVMTVTQQRVFARRNIPQLPRHAKLLAEVYAGLVESRTLADQPPTL